MTVRSGVGGGHGGSRLADGRASFEPQLKARFPHPSRPCAPFTLTVRSGVGGGHGGSRLADGRASFAPQPNQRLTDPSRPLSTVHSATIHHENPIAKRPRTPPYSLPQVPEALHARPCIHTAKILKSLHPIPYPLT